MSMDVYNRVSVWMCVRECFCIYRDQCGGCRCVYLCTCVGLAIYKGWPTVYMHRI